MQGKEDLVVTLAICRIPYYERGLQGSAGNTSDSPPQTLGPSHLLRERTTLAPGKTRSRLSQCGEISAFLVWSPLEWLLPEVPSGSVPDLSESCSWPAHDQHGAGFYKSRYELMGLLLLDPCLLGCDKWATE